METPSNLPQGVAEYMTEAAIEDGMQRAVLVYQAGIANVFKVDTFNMADPDGRKRLLQGSFTTCEMFARGLGAAGVKVGSAACNLAGDIINARWSAMLDDLSINADGDTPPFSDAMSPVWSGVASDMHFAG